MLTQIINLTVKFIIIIFSIVVVFDIIAVIYQSKKGDKNKLGLITITRVFRRWFKEDPLIPYMIGVTFIGHMGCYEWNNLLTYKFRMIVFLSFAIPSLIWLIIEMAKTKRKKDNSKFYLAMCKFWPLPMTIGILVGSFWGKS